MSITMSEIENQDSPTKEEKMEESENSSDEKSEEPSPAKDEKTKTPEKSKTLEKSKTPVKKEEKKKEEEEESEDDEDEDPPLGLLEQPVILTSGKREKKKVERLSMSIHLPNSERKKVDIQEGSGVKLGDCPRIEFKLGHTKAVDLKPLHRVLFTRAGSNNEVKKNIRQFSGFPFGKGDKEFDKRLVSLNKMTIPQLKKICEILDIERSGTKQAVVERIMDFLFKPHSSGLKIPQKKKRRSKSGGDGEKKGAKRKRTSKKDTKGKSKKDTVSDISDSEEDEENDDGEEEKEEKEEEKSESEPEDSEEEEPPKKKAKAEKKKEPAKKENAKSKKQNGKQEKAPKKEKKEAKKKVSDSEDGDSDDEPLAGKKDEPPSNDELKDVIKKILEGANLEEVTMKTVVKQVYEKYPSYDLTDRKDFIKATVKQIIS